MVLILRAKSLTLSALYVTCAGFEAVDLIVLLEGCLATDLPVLLDDCLR